MRQAVLTILKQSTLSISAEAIATRLRAPQASIRRCIGELRAAGINIRSGYYGYRIAVGG